MDVGGRGRRAALAAAVLVLASVGLVACNGGGEDPTPTPTSTVEPTPSPTHSPSPTPTMSLEEANIADAEASITEYVRLSNEVENSGGDGWEALIDWWGTPEIQSRFSRFYETVQADGIYTEGSSQLASISLIEYVEDPTGAGHEQIRFDLCLDTSGVTQFDADGSTITPTGTERFVTAVMLQHQGVDSMWTINEYEADPDRAC